MRLETVRNAAGRCGKAESHKRGEHFSVNPRIRLYTDGHEAIAHIPGGQNLNIADFSALTFSWAGSTSCVENRGPENHAPQLDGPGAQASAFGGPQSIHDKPAFRVATWTSEVCSDLMLRSLMAKCALELSVVLKREMVHSDAATLSGSKYSSVKIESKPCRTTVASVLSSDHWVWVNSTASKPLTFLPTLSSATTLSFRFQQLILSNIVEDRDTRTTRN
ncbi:uncharacterized protein B0I36DRAFT_343559 [Microdochium trichocladiopsis]|uniref:Uncharacterized protein n=1 Tax=Microdochium trichocladiopsis TaxID=1682393 RepID=A0A9P9BVG3_9PEZI|nr:uncharacterized protein B0I36DRAFT_343559 [Microdochium trichocladiopsis]KAH7039702.1 hypothetical protein B0I36DRAFT_343559 [Microdochium trichocladiopsis]